MVTSHGIAILQLINVLFLIALSAMAIGATIYQLTGDRQYAQWGRQQRPGARPEPPGPIEPMEKPDRRAA